MNSKRISIASAPKPAFTGIKPAEAVRVSTATIDCPAKRVLLRPRPATRRLLHSSKDIEGFLTEMAAQANCRLEKRSPIFPPYSAQRWGQSNCGTRQHLLARVNQASTMKGNQMTVKALVMSDRSDEYTGKKGLVKQQIITVMDLSDTGERLAQPIEYALSDEEKPVHAGKLQDKVINLGIRELIPFGGRMRARGRIVGLIAK
jgi:hypothetical protein